MAGAERRRIDAVTWVLRILLAAVFLYEGVDKFSERRLWIRIFEEIGIGQWFRYFTGAVELMGAVMLVVPRATFIGAGLLMCAMSGALIVHVLVTGIGPQTVAVSMLLLMLLVVAARLRTSKEPNEGRAAVEVV